MPKSRSEPRPSDPEGRVAKIYCIRVKSLQRGTSVQELKLPKLEEPKRTRTVTSKGTRGGNPLYSGEITPERNKCAGVETLKEPKRTRTVRSRGMGGGNPLYPGESTLGGMSA